MSEIVKSLLTDWCQLPYLDNQIGQTPFIMDTDASDTGIGAGEQA